MPNWEFLWKFSHFEPHDQLLAQDPTNLSPDNFFTDIESIKTKILKLCKTSNVLTVCYADIFHHAQNA